MFISAHQCSSVLISAPSAKAKEDEATPEDKGEDKGDEEDAAAVAELKAAEEDVEALEQAVFKVGH